MFYIIEVEDYVRVEPELFGLPTKDAVFEQLKKSYTNYVERDIGFVVAIFDVLEIGEGIIVPGDGAAYYNTTFRLLVWQPELQEIVFCTIKEITSFGAIVDLGIAEGMIHISQTMEDFVGFSKSGALVGKTTKKSLKKGDSCLARIVAISWKEELPKIGLTMRQPGLGKLEWIEEEKRKEEKKEKKKK